MAEEPHDDDAELEAECRRLREEVTACEEALDSLGSDRDRQALPAWAHRCVWRDELDVRADQLERISLQFDATKHSLDAANEELQWQATSAEALRMRLADVLRTIKAEEAEAAELLAEQRQSENAVEELLQQHTRPGGESPGGRNLTLVCQQAQWLLESIRRSGNAEGVSSANIAAASGGGSPAAGRSKSGSPGQIERGPRRDAQ
eukprot:gnl/TRDRNA2_/TRDRNA2_90180_c0_seq1.p1 gnl/TRDRNA2_/TRDRNA2_90180_c0~~gnl/TRDRNA2_/TRDRNA2_90180_c0_seq1.p1  ORF type:complete len:230 (-),score=52.04 gnl/TRDRNA2_/TRDRNA2_90180_c0_seq1:26-640(-)